jgi:hypothetical protein
VQKVIQLSFSLPVMNDSARARFARNVLRERFENISSGDLSRVLKEAERSADRIVAEEVPIGDKGGRTS